MPSDDVIWQSVTVIDETFTRNDEIFRLGFDGISV